MNHPSPRPHLNAVATTFNIGWRLFRREWRAGELRLLSIALITGIACICTVSVFVDRLERGMTRGASDLLAADLIISATQPLPQSLSDKAWSMNLTVATTVSFRSVSVAKERYQLSQVKAVSDGYPLRGELKISQGPINTERVVRHGPTRGEAWVEPRLLQALDLQIGDRVSIGEASFRIAAQILVEPDRGADAFNIAPRIMFNLHDLAATELIKTGSRVRYRLLVAGDSAAVSRFAHQVTPQLEPTQQLQRVEDARPQIRGALSRARRFLGLAALAGLLLSGIAIALSARRHAERHFDTAALLRALGANGRTVARIFLLQLLAIGLIATGLGVVLGYLAQWLLATMLDSLLLFELPAPGMSPAVIALGVGLVTLLGFSLAPLMALSNVPSMRVLRRTQGPPLRDGLISYTLAALAALGLLAWQAGDVRLFIYLCGGITLTLAAMTCIGLGLIKILTPLRRARLPGGRSVGWHYGVASIIRRGRSSVLQIVAFGVGLTLMLMLTMVRTSLIGDWQRSLPANAPNHFLMNIQADERVAVLEYLRSIDVPAPTLFPLIPARLVEHNGRAVRAENYSSTRAARLVARDFSLSYSTTLKPYNQLAAGNWWSKKTNAVDELSVEVGLADTLGLRIGDTLRFAAAGRELSGRIVNLRKVDWNSFGVNFFVEARPELLVDFPASYITSVFIPADKKPLLYTLVRSFPSITIIDVDIILAKVREIMDQAAKGIELILLFTLLAGLLVLIAGIQATLDERRHEAALLLTLGASRRDIVAALCTEFALLGGISGLLAALAALGLGALIAGALLNLEYSVRLVVLPVGILLGAGGFTLFGFAGTRRVFSTPPSQVLRAS